jgi:autotransporter-associated beta strand protein
LENVSGTNNYGGLVTLGAASTISSDSGTLNLDRAAGAVNLNSHGLTVNGSGNTVISGVISGGGANSTLTKSGSGTLTVTAANSYGGGTQVNGGTLLVNNTSGSGTGPGAVTVTNTGSTLGGTGAITGAVTVNAGAKLAPGNGGHTAGVLSIGKGALTLQPGSNFLVDINGPNAGTGYDQLAVTGAMTITGSNLVIHVSTTLTVGEAFLIVDKEGGDVIGQFAQGTEVTANNGDTFSIRYNGGAGGDKDDISITVTSVTSVPEPSTWIGGALAVAALAYTQRRRLRKLVLLRRAYGGQVVRS